MVNVIMLAPLHVVLTVIINNVSSYTRSRLCMCSRWCMRATIEVSVEKILERVGQRHNESNAIAHLEEYYNAPMVGSAYITIKFIQQLRDAFANGVEGAPANIYRCVYEDYHLFIRNVGKNLSQLFRLSLLNSVLYGDDDVCVAIVQHLLQECKYDPGIITILAARGKRELALQLYDAPIPRINFLDRSAALYFGALLAADTWLAEYSKCTTVHYAVHAACLLGDDKLVDEYLDANAQGKLDGHIWGVDEPVYAAIGGCADEVMRWYATARGYSSYNVRLIATKALSTYCRGPANRERYHEVIKRVASPDVLFDGILDDYWPYVDVPIVQTFVETQYTVRLDSMLRAVAFASAPVVKYVLDTAAANERMWICATTEDNIVTKSINVIINARADTIAMRDPDVLRIFTNYMIAAAVPVHIVMRFIESAARANNSEAVLILVSALNTSA